VAGNTAGGGSPDIDPGTGIFTVNFSLIGSAVTPDAGSGNLVNDTPLLGPLQDNGGPTETLALLVGSPAIDAGDPAAVPGVGNTPLFDQRGLGRVVQGRIDIGSFEVQVAPTADIVDVTPDPRNTSVGNVTVNFDQAVTTRTLS